MQTGTVLQSQGPCVPGTHVFCSDPVRGEHRGGREQRGEEHHQAGVDPLSDAGICICAPAGICGAFSWSISKALEGFFHEALLVGQYDSDSEKSDFGSLGYDYFHETSNAFPGTPHGLRRLLGLAPVRPVMDFVLYMVLT